MDDIICTIPSFDYGVWSISHYWAYEDGFSVGDADGNHDDCEEEDIPSATAVAEAWKEYSWWVLKNNGEDPLREFLVARTVESKWRVRLSNSIVGVVACEFRRNGRQVMRDALSQEVVNYLCLHPNRRNVIGVKKVSDVDPITRAGWHDFKIKSARSDAAIRRDIVNAAKRHLNIS